MAARRMFEIAIIDSDLFLEMPLTTQCLYFHLSMRADDDGFISNSKRIQRTVCASDDDLKILLAKQFLIPFDSGIVVIRHWKRHNEIKKDRYKPTLYGEEKALISIDTNNVYKMDTECIQSSDKMETQVRLGKVSIGKDR
ncbi:MAG: DNA replication protein [Clostridia bacterium]